MCACVASVSSAPQSTVSSSSPAVLGQACKPTGKWFEQASEIIRSGKRRKLTLGQHGWVSSGMPCPGVVKTHRNCMLLDLGWRLGPAGANAPVPGVACGEVISHFVDLSQNPCKDPWGKLRCLQCNTELFSYYLQRRVAPVEHLYLLGFGDVCTQGLSGRDVQDLAGEAMSLPCLAAILLEMPWRAKLKVSGEIEGIWR